MKKAKRRSDSSRELAEFEPAETLESDIAEPSSEQHTVLEPAETLETETAEPGSEQQTVLEPAETPFTEMAAPASEDSSDTVATVATVAVVCVAAATFEVSLLPGIVLGVAAVAVPNYLPQIGAALNPLFRSTVRAAYKLGHKTREMVAEAREQVHDIVAEVHAEQRS